MLDQFEEGLFASELRPLLRWRNLHVVRRVHPGMKGLFLYGGRSESLVESVEEVMFDGMLLDLAAEGFDLGDQFLYGEAEGGGKHCLELQEVDVDLVM